MNLEYKKFALHYEGIVAKFPQHNQIKDELLSLISTTNSQSLGEVTSTDWMFTSNPDRDRRYFDCFFYYSNPFFKHVFTNICMFPSSKHTVFIDFWFQQYADKGYHKVHQHANSDFSAVYYVDLPNKDSTVFYNQFYDTYQTVDAEEGDIIIFPSIFLHTSLPSEKKTVIAMNFRFC